MLEFIKKCFENVDSGTAAKKANRKSRSLRVENCEERVLLTVSPLQADLPQIEQQQYAALDFTPETDVLEAVVVNMDSVDTDTVDTAAASEDTPVTQPMNAEYEVMDEAGLRAAITNAVDGDVITLTGNIELTGADALPTINANVTIDGANGDTNYYIDGGKTLATPRTTGIFSVAPGKTVTIQNITLKNGKTDYGGAIDNLGTLTLDNVTIDSCIGTLQGGGIWTSGTLTSTKLTVKNCKATGNQGGGLFNNGGTVTLEGTNPGDILFENNSCNTGGGGGGAHFESSTVSIKNAEFKNNDSNAAGGGIDIWSSTVTLSGEVTVTGNTATSEGNDIANRNGTLKISDADDTTVTVGDLNVATGKTLDYNDKLTATTVSNTGTFKSSSLDSNFTTTTPFSITGGVITLTNSGTITGTGTFTLTSGKFVSIGGKAVRVPSDKTTGTVSWDGEEILTTGDAEEVTGIDFSNITTAENLFYALVQANTSDTDSTLTLKNNITLTVNTVLPELKPGKTITINGGGYTLDCATVSRAFNITSGAVNINNLTIKNGKATGNNGGGICNKGTLTLDTVTIDSCTSSNGGGIWTSGTLTSNKLTISNCTIANQGGGLFNNGGKVTLEGTAPGDIVFEGNTASSNGGGAHFEGGSTVSIKNAEFNNNTSNTVGGGIDIWNSTVTLSGTVEFTNNMVKTDIKDIANRNGTLKISTDGTSVTAGDLYVTSGKEVVYNNILTVTTVGNDGKYSYGSSDNQFTSTSTFAIADGVVVLDSSDAITITAGAIPVSGNGTVNVKQSDSKTNTVTIGTSENAATLTIGKGTAASTITGLGDGEQVTIAAGSSFDVADEYAEGAKFGTVVIGGAEIQIIANQNGTITFTESTGAQVIGLSEISGQPGVYEGVQIKSGSAQVKGQGDVCFGADSENPVATTLINSTDGVTASYDATNGAAMTINAGDTVTVNTGTVTITGPTSGTNTINLAAGTSAVINGVTYTAGTTDTTFTLVDGVVTVLVSTDAELRDAITNANADANITQIKLSAYIDVSSALPTITSANLTIDGGGFTLDGQSGGYRIFNSSSANLTLKNLTIANAGSGTTAISGPALNNSGTATLDNVTITGCKSGTADAGAIYNTKVLNCTTSMTISGCTAGYQGGAIYSTGSGTLNLQGASEGSISITGNTSGVNGSYINGGGILSVGNATLKNVSITGNFSKGGCAGLSLENGTTTALENVVVTGNQNNSPETPVDYDIYVKAGTQVFSTNTTANVVNGLGTFKSMNGETTTMNMTTDTTFKVNGSTITVTTSGKVNGTGTFTLQPGNYLVIGGRNRSCAFR